MRVYTDGACSGNPGPGGWAWATTDGRSGSGGALDSTNQRMELQAVLDAVKTLDGPIDIYSDSTYVVKCFNDKWYQGWLDRGWRNSQKKPVANRDIWEPLISEYLANPERLRFFWVKGHSGDRMNDLVDALAVAEVGKLKEAASSLTPCDEISAPWIAERAVAVVGVGTQDIETARRAVTQLNANSILVSGLRRGLELDLAEFAIESGMEVGVVLPFADPVAHWGEVEQQRFEATLAAAKWVVTLEGDRNDPSLALSNRNVWLKSWVIAVITGDAKIAAAYDQAGVSVINV